MIRLLTVACITAAVLLMFCASAMAQQPQTPGTWLNVTPPLLDSAIRAGGSWGGMCRILADPVRLTDIYANCDGQGTWKSTDYGLTWTKMNTGINGDKVNSGRQWSAVIDPRKNRDPSTMPAIYVSQGFGVGGLWKSTDGGVNWTNVWNNNIYAPDGVTNISGDVGADIGGFCMLDSTSPNHLLQFLHGYWGTGGNNGLFETTDGGAKWIVHRAQTFNFQPHADGAFGISPTTWFVAHGTTYPNSELYRTTDGGNTWAVIANNTWIGAGMWVGSTYYASGSPMQKTTDMGATWTKVTTAGDVGTMCVTATNHFYASIGDAHSNGGPMNFRHSTIGNDAAWVDDPVPTGMYKGKGNNQDIGNGLLYSLVSTYDGTNAIIISGCWMAGVWRYVEPATGTNVDKSTIAAVSASLTHATSSFVMIGDKQSLSKSSPNTLFFDVKGQVVNQGRAIGRQAVIVRAR